MKPLLRMLLYALLLSYPLFYQSCSPRIVTTMAKNAVMAPVSLFTSATPARDVALGWDDTNTIPLKGFKLYIYKPGCLDYVLEAAIDISGGKTRTYVLPKFRDTYKSSSYVFEMTAVGIDNQESLHSNYVRYST